MIFPVVAVAVGAVTLGVVVLCSKSRKTGSKPNVDNVEISTGSAAATDSTEELSKELSGLNVASSEGRVLGRRGGGEPSLEENVVKLSGKSSRKRNKKKSALKDLTDVTPDVVGGNVSSIPSANSEKEEDSSIPQERAASLATKYLEQDAKPKVRQRTSIKQTKTGEKASALPSNVKSTEVNSTSQKSTKVQDVEGKTSDHAIKGFTKAEDISNSGNSTISKDDVAVSARSMSSQYKKKEENISSYQVKTVQSLDGEPTGDQHTSKKESAKKKKKTRSVSKGISDELLDTSTAVGHTNDVSVSTVQVVGILDPASEAREHNLEQEYLRQGAKPKVLSSQPRVSTVTKKGVDSESDTQKSKAVQSTAQEKIIHSSSADTEQRGTELTSAQATLVRHMGIKRVFVFGSLKEHVLGVREFRKGVACFAKMHLDYTADLMFDIFDIKDGGVMLKPNILNALLKISNHEKLLVFLVKNSLAGHLLVRLGYFAVLAYFKYCASHYYDPKCLDELLVKVMHLGIYNLKTVSQEMLEVFLDFHSRFKNETVFCVYPSSFYTEVLSIFYDFASTSIRNAKLRAIGNLIKLSCAVHFGNMYSLIIRSGDAARCQDKEMLESLMCKGQDIRYKMFYAGKFSHVCCNARETASHLYSPYKNSICVVSGFSFPLKIVRICSDIFQEVEEHIRKGIMNFEVFSENIACRLTRPLYMSNTVHLVKRDIMLYKEVIEEKYKTMGNIQSSFML